MYKISGTLSFALLLLFSLYPVFSQANIAGQIINAQGDIYTEDERELNTSDAVYAQDTIVTGDNSSAKLKMIDGAIIELGANSKLKLDEYRYKEDSDDNAVFMSVVQGFFRTVSGLVGKNNPEAYRVETPLSSIGIQGTEYQVLIKEKDTYIGTRQGVIVVKEKDSFFGQEKTSQLGDEQAGRFLHISSSNTRALGSAWEISDEIPDDFPAEFQR